MYAIINLHDILVLQHNVFLTRVRRVMCHDVVEGKAGRESQARLETISRLDAWISK